MKKYDFLIIGGDAAGMSAASQARRTDERMSIAVLEKGEHVSYAACGIPYYIGGDIDDAKSLIAIDRKDYEVKRNIEIRTGTEATSVNFEARTVSIQSREGSDTLAFEKLLIASGARPFIPPIRGIDIEGVFCLRDLADGIAIKNYLSKRKPRTGIIIGGGFIGLEMAEAMRKLGMKTLIIEKLMSVAMSMSPDVRNLITSTLKDNGVDIHTGVTVESIDSIRDGLLLHTDGGSFEGDFILASAGIVPNTDFLKTGGPAMTDRGAVIVDEKSRTDIPGVYAAGDCATVKNLITGRDVYMPLGTTANKQGRVAGLHAAGIESETFRGIVGSQMVKVFDLEVGKTGLNEEDALREGITPERSSVVWKSKAGYCPDAARIYIELTINADTRAIIGGEAAGTDGAALRSNVIAAAVTAGMVIEDVAYMDLGYAPPFSPVWDPINAAAQKLLKRRPT
ncbi:MAG: hypothetical protein E4G96_06640 [Chrysiogenales bacterium]|nr:MAG: hypothetical protein E4G96_06640 [Chrysiogenales bacterium]